jgi:putative ABC transport system permease protein
LADGDIGGESCAEDGVAMSMWTRVRNVFRGERLNGEIQEEMDAHLAEAVAQGRDPEEARRAFGSAMRRGEESHTVRVVGWLDSLRADVVFGWRQLMKRKVTTGVAVLSLALAIGACTSAFRLVDAMLLRPLPISDPGRLYGVHFDGFSIQGEPERWDTTSYPSFQKMRDAVKGQAELIAIARAQRIDLTYGSDEEIERAQRQYVSGWMFSSFGLKPALGRLFTEDDDRVPGAKPYAVLSYGYWASRFGRDPKVIGRSFRIGDTVYEIVGVSEQRFIGTEPGTIPDIFVPTMMNGADAIRASGNAFLLVFVRPYPGVAIEAVRARMYAAYLTYEYARVKDWTFIPKSMLAVLSQEKLLLKPAGAGVSQLQEDYQGALVALGALVVLVLLIACANVANLMTAQTASRAREMALRVSIGAGRLRLMQMVMVESVMLALLAAGLGGLFAWWAAPFVVSRINPSDNPVQLILPADWRVLGFGLLLSLAVALLFGLAPALRASSVKPVSALKGGDEPHSRRRAMHVLIAAQVAFCFVVLFLSGLFVKTFHRLQDQPLGFSGERVVLLDTVSRHVQPAAAWDQMAEHLKGVPGVETASMTSWGLLSGQVENSLISVNGVPPSKVLGRFLFVSPGWLETMKIPLVAGRDFRASDVGPHTAIVNRTFARVFFGGENPVGKSFAWPTQGKWSRPFEVVGLVEDAAYKDVHDAMLPVAYIPLNTVDATGVLQPRRSGMFVVRTASADPMVMGQTLRQEVQRAQPEFRVRNVTTQMELVRAQTIRERLLAMLAAFFAGVALLLAAIGLYGVLSYSVLEREKEFGIRIAVGAQIGNIARLVTTQVFVMVVVGAGVGIALGMASVRFVETLLFGVKGNDPTMLLVPTIVLLVAALLAALPAVLRAVRIDPVIMLRAE